MKKILFLVLSLGILTTSVYAAEPTKKPIEIRQGNIEERKTLRITITQERIDMLKKQQEVREKVREEIQAELKKMQEQGGFKNPEQRKEFNQMLQEKRKELIEGQKMERKEFREEKKSQWQTLKESIKASWMNFWGGISGKASQ